MDFSTVDDAFNEAVASGVFPGAVVLVAKGEEVVLERAYGFRSLLPEKSPMETDTIFDLASLTKCIATTTAIMLLVKEGKIRLDDRVTRFVPNFGVFNKNHVSFRHLLAHCSGLSAWKPYFEEIVKGEKDGGLKYVASRAAESFVFERVHREKPLAPSGNRVLYSDLGFIVLSEIVEQISGRSFDRFCQERIFQPLGLDSTFFVDLTQLLARRFQPDLKKVAPTENCPWRKKIICGEVHDDNAYAMGGVAGHAGLFSPARDIHRYLSRLRRCYDGKDSFLPADLVKEFLKRDETVSGSTYALGWDTPTPTNSSSGGQFSPLSVGHLGFTGCSIWWDLEKNCSITLLTNRIHPLRNNNKIRDFRPTIHDLIMQTLFP
jgi:CubicO group peptidase (beta-lactamase class C family)